MVSPVLAVDAGAGGATLQPSLSRVVASARALEVSDAPSAATAPASDDDDGADMAEEGGDGGCVSVCVCVSFCGVDIARSPVLDRDATLSIWLDSIGGGGGTGEGLLRG